MSMSKSILVIDTPMNCYQCPLQVMESDMYYTYFTCKNDCCVTNDSQEMTRLEMNCPLKPLKENYISIDWIKQNIPFQNEEDGNILLSMLDVWRNKNE